MALSGAAGAIVGCGFLSGYNKSASAPGLFSGSLICLLGCSLLTY